MVTELEKVLTSCHKLDMVAYIAEHPKVFDELLTLAMSDKQPYAWRAAWLLWSCMEENDERVAPYLEQFVQVLPQRKKNQQREIIKILSFFDLDENLEGKVFDLCAALWENIGNEPAIRYNAFKLMLKIIKKHPELKDEMAFFTQEQYIEPLTPGAKHSILKMLKTNTL